MNKKQLLALIAKKNTAKEALRAKIEGCEDVKELRSMQTEWNSLNDEIRELQAMADAMPDEQAPAAAPPVAAIDEVDLRTKVVTGQIPSVVVTNARAQEVRTADTDDMEYRKAFMSHVLRGTPIPNELRADAHTLTTDVSSAIPTVLVNRIVERLESIGMILPLINRTSYAAGVQIPTSTVKPTATWVAEGASSDKQKKTTGFISFSHFKLRCEISLSMEVGTMAISAFETTFVRQVSEAMVKQIESTILSNANGATSPRGIFAETPPTGQALTAATLTYDLLVTAEGALPQAYEGNAVWCMTKKTFMAFMGMVDQGGQPIARINYGIAGKPERYLMGRQVVLCGDYMPSFSAALAAGTIFACLFNFNDYTLNTIYDMGVQRKQDWDTEGLLTKAVMSVDGKVVDNNSLVTIARAAGV